MSEKQPFLLTTRERNHSDAVHQEETRIVSSGSERPPRRTPRRRRDVWFLLLVLLLGMTTIIVLTNTVARQSGQSRATATRPGSPPVSATKAPLITPSPILATGAFREYPLPQANSQVMRLAVDHEGRIWLGEMGRNALAVFDPRTRAYREITPPHGRSGIMGIQVAADDTIWFAEQYANYIGHYFPTTGTFHLYPLPSVTTPDPGNAGKTLTLPSAPNDLALDTHGDVWFAEFNADRLGRLDPRTGDMQHYMLASKRTVQQLAPYGVTVDPQGMVWFTEMGGGHIGRLDPATGRIQYFPLPGVHVPLMEIASDAHGTIWATSFNAGLLLRLDSRTGAVTSYYASFTGADPGGLYGLAVTLSGDVWVTILTENALARLDAATHRFSYYRVPTENSGPLALVAGADQTLWFSENEKIGLLRL
jgi:streptogramin lyase